MRALPFHALIAPDRHFLIEHHACIYAPNLQPRQHLRALPCASIQAETLRQLFDRRGLYLRAEQATRQRALDLNESGQLATFDPAQLCARFYRAWNEGIVVRSMRQPMPA